MDFFGWSELDVLKTRKERNEVVSFDNVSLNSLKRRGNIIAFTFIGISIISCSFIGYEIFKLDKLKNTLYPDIKLYEGVVLKYNNGVKKFKNLFNNNVLKSEKNS